MECLIFVSDKFTGSIFKSLFIRGDDEVMISHDKVKFLFCFSPRESFLCLIFKDLHV